MKIGLDFDNTIVCYDHAFHVAACERGWLKEEVAPTKEAVKSSLQLQGRNDDWTELQGYVYGPGMKEAELFPGLLDFLLEANLREWQICVVSHRTRHPYRGPQYDLHEAARAWIDDSGILESKTGLTREGIYFETSKEAKVARIKEQGVALFFDDLPDILEHSDFPVNVGRVLFDPNDVNSDIPFKKIRRWAEAIDAVNIVRPS